MIPFHNEFGDGKTPLVSIITPVYNRAEYLAETIDSVLAQTFTDWELIIIDDGSEVDDNRRIAESYCERDERIRYRYECHGGTSAARNHGISLAKGTYLAFLDSDDRYLPQGLALLVAAMQSAPQNVKLIYANFIKYYQHENRFQPTKVKHPFRRPDLYFQFLIPGSNPIAPCACLLERNVLDEIGGFDTLYNIIEDRELWSRLIRIYDIAHVAKEVAIYRKHDNQFTHQKIQKRLSNDLQAYTFFSSLSLEQWFPKAKDAKNQAVALQQLAILLFKSLNPPLDTALYLLRLAQQLHFIQQRQDLLLRLESDIPKILRNEYGCDDRITISSVN